MEENEGEVEVEDEGPVWCLAAGIGGVPEPIAAVERPMGLRGGAGEDRAEGFGGGEGAKGLTTFAGTVALWGIAVVRRDGGRGGGRAPWELFESIVAVGRGRVGRGTMGGEEWRMMEGSGDDG